MDNKELFNKLYERYDHINSNDLWVNEGVNKKVGYFIEKDSDNNLIILFQGTDGAFDWLCNLVFIPRTVVPYKNMPYEFKVHSGFWGQFTSIRDKLLEIVKSEVDKGVNNIYIYGWSLGGRLAMFCKEMVAFNFPKVTSHCITAGAPRGFIKTKYWENIKDRFDNTTRYVNGSDLVPVVPFKIFGGSSGNFTHEVTKTQVGEKFNKFKTVEALKYHVHSEYHKKINTAE